jgi:hypothetical protein
MPKLRVWNEVDLLVFHPKLLQSSKIVYCSEEGYEKVYPWSSSERFSNPLHQEVAQLMINWIG